jgi:hypothetical protein
VRTLAYLGLAGRQGGDREEMTEAVPTMDLHCHNYRLQVDTAGDTWAVARTAEKSWVLPDTRIEEVEEETGFHSRSTFLNQETLALEAFHAAVQEDHGQDEEETSAYCHEAERPPILLVVHQKDEGAEESYLVDNHPSLPPLGSCWHVWAF